MEKTLVWNEVNLLVQTHSKSVTCRHSGENDCCKLITSVDNVKFCSLFDTGAQVSLISEELWKRLKSNNDDLHLIDDETKLIGVGNQKINIIGIVNLKFRILDIDVDESIPFAVVNTEFMPRCCIVGANFLSKNQMIFDFNKKLLLYQNANGEELLYPIKEKSESAISFQGAIETALDQNSQSGISDEEDSAESQEAKFNVKYKFLDSMSELQNNDYAIKCLKSKVYDQIMTKRWRESPLNQFKRYFSELVLDKDILFRDSFKGHTIVLPFPLLLEIVYKTHSAGSYWNCQTLCNRFGVLLASCIGKGMQRYLSVLCTLSAE